MAEWFRNPNIPKAVDIETANVSWRYECSRCHYLSQKRFNICPSCHANMHNSIKLYGVGVGPGDPELLTIKAINAIKQSKVLAYPSFHKRNRAFDTVKEALDISDKILLPLETLMATSGQQESHIKASQEIIKHLNQSRSVAFITIGDPTIYSNFFYIQSLVQEQGYQTEVINGITSFTHSAAQLQIPLCLGDERVTITTGTYKEVPGTLVIMKPNVNSVMLERLTKGKEVYAVEHCGLPTQRIYRGFDELPDKLEYLSIIIVKEKR